MIVLVITAGGGFIFLIGFILGAILARMIVYEMEGRPDIFGEV